TRWPRGWSSDVCSSDLSFIVSPADGRFGQIEMTVTSRIVAFPKQRRVLFIGKRSDVQTMRSAETHLHSEKHAPASPGFGEKICRSEERRVGKKRGSRRT